MQGPWSGTYSSFLAAVPSDTALVNCRAIYVNCTVAGNVTVQGGPPGNPGPATAFAVPVGVTILPVELNEGILHATGTTATATYVLLA